MLRALWRHWEPELAPMPTPMSAPTPTPLPASSPTPPVALFPTPATAPRATPRRRRRIRQIWRILLLDEANPSRQPSAEEHARRLLAWLRRDGFGGEEVLAADAAKLYATM